MIGFALNQQRQHDNAGFNDIYLDDDGNIATVDNLDDLTQTIINVLWMWVAEYDFNTSLGIPYKKILGNSLDEGLITYYLTDAIVDINNYMDRESSLQLGINKVVVKSLSLDRVNGKLSADLYLILQNGDTFNMGVTNASN